MVSRRRNDDRPIGRRGPSRMPKRRILIVCEGRETERRYFEAFQHAVRNPRVHVKVARETGVPTTVVECAIELRAEAEQEAKHQRDDNLLWDEVWGVFDVDDHPNLELAIARGAASGIKLAVSNPCFELWALLHFQDQRAHIERGKLRALLQQHLPGYDKTLDFARVHPGYGKAIERAGTLAQEAERAGAPGRNPTTGVVHLTESIRREGTR
jgi:hypothetical protein